MEGLTLNDIIWNSNYFDFRVENDDKDNYNELNISLCEFSEKPSRPSKSLVDIKEYKKLIDIKQKIPKCTHWDKWSRLINPYDKVSYLAKNKNGRDYYKFYEIIKYFKLLQNFPDEFSSAHIGETAASFVKVLLYFKPKADWYLQKIDSKMSKTKSGVDLSSLEQTDYNIISDNSENEIKNLENFGSNIPKILFFTADISIDISHDSDNQEQLIFHLIFAQVLLMLKSHQLGGNGVIKIFDSLTRPTCQLIYFLTKFYEFVNIIKPRICRYSEAEKFIIFRNFKGIDKDQLTSMQDVLKEWKENLYFRVIGIQIPDNIEKQFFDYNNNLIKNQITYIEKTINCNYNEDEIPEKQLEAFQNRKAIDFCTFFGISLNLSESELSSVCKHTTKKKIHVPILKNCMVCEKCLCLIISKT